jgi:hypothetical protein
MPTLQPYIDQQFTGAIWRLEIDELSDMIFVEVRNDAEKQVSFSALSLNNGQVYFTGLTTPERWLTGIEAVYDGIMLLHNYQSASGPIHKGLVAIDGISGENIWSNYTCAFDHLSTNGPVVYDTRIHPKKLFLADIRTGETTRIYQPLVFAELTNNVVAPQVIAPEMVPVGMLPMAPFGNSVHYLEHNNFRIVSLHTLQAGELKQYLFVMNGGETVYEDLLNADIQKLQPEAFIVHKNRLVYIKNKTDLKVLSLISTYEI